jgi:flagellar biosynthetic protein FliR
MILNLPLATVETFLFVLLRMGALLTAVPFLDSRVIPFFFKFGLIVALSLLLMPMIAIPAQPLAGLPLVFGLAVVKELLIGATIGLVVRLLFAGIQMAGQLIGFQMGFAIANVIDPATSDQVPLLAQFVDLVATLVFLLINAHHVLIRALVGSFEAIPPGGFQVSRPLALQLVHNGGQMFMIALQVGAPVIVALLLTSVALGLVARTVPQMNIFIVAMPLNIIVGLLFLGVSLPYLSGFLQRLFGALSNQMPLLLRAMG